MADRVTTFRALVDEGLLEIGDGYRAKNEELGGTGHIFLRAGHVQDTHIDFAGVERFHQELSGRVTSKLSQPGDTIVTTKGNSTGRTAFADAAMPPFVYSPHLSYWRSRDHLALAPLFLRYWSRGAEFAAQLSGMKASTDMAPYLSLTDQARLRITVPTPRVQAALGRILGSLDDKIELNRQTNETLETMARALFKSWFVDFDPVRAKAEGRAPVGMDAATAALFPDGFEGSGIPRGWGERPLYDCATWVNGAAYRDFEFCSPDQGFPIVKIAELKAGITRQTRFTLTNPGDKYLIDTGDVLFSWSGNPDTSIDTFVWARGKGWLNQHIFKVITASRYERTFVLWLLRHLRPVFAEIARNKQTTGLGHVTAGDMKRLQVVVPAASVLAAFDAAVGPLSDLMHAREVESLTLARLRDALLPKLLSGELRVRDAEKAVEQVA